MSQHEDEFYGRPELVKQRARALIWTRIAWAIIGLFIISSLAILVFNAIQSISTRQALLDCTTPHGDCYEKGQKQTGDVIQQLIDASKADGDYTRHIVVITTSCAEEDAIQSEPSRDVRITMIQNCVDDRLSKEKEAKKHE